MKKTFFKTALFMCMAVAVLTVFNCFNGPRITSFEQVDEYPSIFPDYTGIDIPPNIAPLNFMIREHGSAFHVVLRTAAGDSLVISSSKSLVSFPTRQWRRMIGRCAGESLTVEINVRKEKGWTKFKPLRNFVAKEPIDPYVVYRLINPGYELWSEMGIYQRDLESFRETPIFKNISIDHACINCHSFCRNDPAMMTLQLRKAHSGTLICREGTVEKINTKTGPTRGAAVYPSWHPGGKVIAFSVNGVVQDFPSGAGWYIEVRDTVSDLVFYNCESHSISTSASVSTPELENLPAWSPDGKYLYYCRAHRPQGLKYFIDEATGSVGVQQADGTWSSDSIDFYGTGESVWLKRVKELKYDLMGISFNPEKNTWGTPEPVLTSAQTEKSVSFPRVSPDGRFLMFCMSAFGYFTIHHADADLYVMDLSTRHYQRLDEVNSDEAESFHSWSSNGRWFVFSSKRLDGIRARPFISYFDTSGRARKPFLLPQNDPGFYSTFFMTYNIPELVTGKVRYSSRLLRDRSIGPVKDVLIVK